MTLRRVGVLVVLCILLAIAFLPLFSHAQGIPKQIVPETCTGVNCSCDDLVKLASNVLNYGIFISVFMSALLFAWAGFRYLTQVASPEGKNQAKEILRNVVIGLVMIIAAWLIVDTLLKTLQKNVQGNGMWSALCG